MIFRSFVVKCLFAGSGPMAQCRTTCRPNIFLSGAKCDYTVMDQNRNDPNVLFYFTGLRFSKNIIEYYSAFLHIYGANIVSSKLKIYISSRQLIYSKPLLHTIIF